MGDLKDATKDLSTVVPDLYYDLISRVVPGALILIVLGGLFVGPHAIVTTVMSLNVGSGTICLVALLVLAYSIAMSSAAIGECVRCVYLPFVWRWLVRSSGKEVAALEQRFCLGGLSRAWSPRKIDNAYRLVHEELRTTGDRSIVLSKMQAEANQFTVLVGFFALLTVAILLRRVFPQSAETFLRGDAVIWTAVVGGLLSLLGSVFRNLRLWQRHLIKLYVLAKADSAAALGASTAR